MATTQTNKRRTAATKRSTSAKKAAATRARRSTASNVKRTQANAKRRVNQPASKQARPVVAQAQAAGAAVGNIVQTGITAGTKVASRVTKRIADLV